VDNLVDWVVTFAAVAVGRGPGLAVLSARSIARLISYILGPQPIREPEGEVTSRSEFQAEVGWTAC
jgi:hypothetical protein